MVQYCIEVQRTVFMHAYFTITFYRCRANWVKVTVTTYRPSGIIVLGIEEDYPKFGLVLAVYVVRTNRILLHTKILQTQQLAHHYRGYIVEHSSSEHKMFYLDDLYNPFPLHHRRLQCDGSTKLLVVTKHHICKAL